MILSLSIAQNADPVSNNTPMTDQENIPTRRTTAPMSSSATTPSVSDLPICQCLDGAGLDSADRQVIRKCGAGDGTRTHDLPLTRRLLWPTELRQRGAQVTQPRTRATS